MSLDNIQLTPFVLGNLFNKSLYDLKPTGEKSTAANISFLGDNKKRIALLVYSPGSIYLPDEELNFLLGILTACKLSMMDVALINISKNPELSYTGITEQIKAEKVFLFGVNPEILKLPLQFPHYQLQHYNNQVYLSSAPLNKLQVDKQEKLKLWNSLKKSFFIRLIS
ncbi:MAG: hypothetical protein IPP96_08990 [Chitinophagaceae bacterium]|nr:hypothetical protein [Chitinophagaceae bacterium]